ncbi:MAG TPA: type IV pilus assembly protein PilM [Oscillatoriaceae cyanobacterium]
MGLFDTIKNKLGLKKSAAIGLDISPDAIVIASLGKTKAGYVLEALAAGPMPPNAIQDGEIVDPSGVGEAIRALLDEHEIESELAVVAVGGQSTIIRLINLPQMPQTELDSYITYEAERYIPFAIDDVNLSNQIVSETSEAGDDQMDVLLVAAQKTLVQSFIDAAGEAGLSLSCVDVASFAVTRALENTNYVHEDQTTAALLIQGPSTDINIMSQGVPKFNRSVFIGYTYLVENLINSLGIDEESAKYMLSQIDADPQTYDGISPEIEQATEIIRPALSELTGEISRSLEFYMSQGATTIDRIVICGKGASLRGLDRFLTTRLGIEVVVGNPFSTIDPGSLEVDENEAPVYVTAVGLAMRGLEN